MKFAAKPVNIFDAVGHVFAILPQAGKRSVADGRWSSGRRRLGHVHLDERPLRDLDVL